MVQVEAICALSMGVRSGPVETSVNGTLVARLARMTLAHRGALALLDRRARPASRHRRHGGGDPRVAGMFQSQDPAKIAYRRRSGGGRP
jgi:hypothetical protein